MSMWAYLLFGAAFVVLFALSAFFSGCETALLSLSPMQIQRLRERKPKAGAAVAAMVADSEHLLATLLIGNTFANAALASVGFAFVVRTGWAPKGYEEVVSIVAVTLLILLFGEISPKQFAIGHAEAMAPFMAWSLRGLGVALWPLAWCLRRAARPFRDQLEPELKAASDAELVSAINLGEEQHQLDQEEGEMLRGILRLGELVAADVMTPRVDLIGVDLHAPPEEQDRLLRRSPFAWLPLWEGSADRIVDFVDVSRYVLRTAQDVGAARCHWDLPEVPEQAGLDDVLITLCRRRLPLAVVVDEYGGTAGLVARGDILEVLSLDAEEESGPPDIACQGANRWTVAGDVALEQLNFELGTHLEAEGADRISGWLAFHSGRLLKVNEQVEADGYRVTVRKKRRRKIVAVLLEDLDPASRRPNLPSAEPEPPPEASEEGAP